MLGIDTNVLVRYLVRDDEAQFGKARRLIQRASEADQTVFVSLLVLMQTEWVLRSRYRLRKPEIVGTLSAMLDADEMRFEHEPTVEEALFVWKEGTAQFADCLIGAHNRRLGCSATATFDARAARLRGFVSV